MAIFPGGQEAFCSAHRLAAAHAVAFVGPVEARATHKVAEAAAAAGVDLDIKGGRHYTDSQLLAGGFDLRNTAARLGHSGGGATTLRHYADPVSQVDRRAAAYLAKLTAGSGRPK
jgi:integrase